MVRVVLKSTNNVKFQNIVGTKGDLEIVGKKFKFRFGNNLVLTSNVVRMLGDLYHVRSREVCIETSNSFYVFEKLDNFEGLFSHYR